MSISDQIKSIAEQNAKIDAAQDKFNVDIAKDLTDYSTQVISKEVVPTTGTPAEQMAGLVKGHEEAVKGYDAWFKDTQGDINTYDTGINSATAASQSSVNYWGSIDLSDGFNAPVEYLATAAVIGLGVLAYMNRGRIANYLGRGSKPVAK